MIRMRTGKPIHFTSETKSVFVSLHPYNIHILDGVRKIKAPRFYNYESKEWEFLYSDKEIIIKALSKLTTIEELEEEIDIIKEESNDISCTQFGYSFKTTPFAHQIDGFNYGMKNDRWLLGDTMGMGKTKQVIDIACAKKEQLGYRHCLIICCVNGIKWNWLKEIETHSNEKGYILGQRISKGKINIGSIPQRLDDLKHIDRINEYFIVTNIETLRNKEIVAQIQKLIKQEDINMCVCDEAHIIKNPNSQQGKGFLKIQPSCRIAVTGTPLINTPIDLYSILKWLGYEEHTFYQFKFHYCIMGGYGGHEVIGYRYLQDLQDKLNKIMLRRKKEDTLDLPEKLYIDEYVDMTPKQEQIYKEVKAQLMMDIDKIILSPNPLAQFTRLRQTTGYPGIISSTIEESAKIDRMVELVEQSVEEGRKVVIFSEYRQVIDQCMKLLKKYNPAIITGKVRDDRRKIEETKFQEDDTCKVLVGTTRAMGVSITLTAGTVEIFMDEPWSREIKKQAEDRCHRIGTKDNVTIYTLLCKNTVDERVHKIVSDKGELADCVVDGELIKGDRKNLVEYLLS